MKEFKIIVADTGDRMKKLAADLEKADMRAILCKPDPLDAQLAALTEKPFALIAEQDGFAYGDLLQSLTNHKNSMQIYIIKNPFDPAPRIRIPESDHIHIIENIRRPSDIANMIKLNALEVYRTEYISQASVAEYVEESVYRALSELCFTANYTGSMYIKQSLEGLCLSEIKRSDSMCKTIYPYIAKTYKVSPASVERSIRTVIKKCWGNSGDDVHVKYFGFVFSDSRAVPTNREFIMILGDALIRDVERYKASLKIDMLDKL